VERDIAYDADQLRKFRDEFPNIDSINATSP
jgi:hypothetical protein